jgi:1-acyl-sn-glycerol-3-phosphate acyltransferase
MWVRGIANDVFAVAWTATLCSGALAKHVLTGDPSLVARWTRPWARGLARAWSMQVRAYGSERIDPHGTYVFMSNHQSQTDIIALFVALPVQPGFLAKQELRKLPFLGRAMEVGGHVFIDRVHRDQAFRSIEDAAAQVAAGRSIAIFPEGTRGDGHEVRQFKKGGFHLVKQAGVPLVPVGIRGSARVMPKNGKLIVPGAVEVHIGEPMSPAHIAELPVPELVQETRRAIAELAGATVEPVPSDRPA